ncbi:MAG: hypothetical protein H7325_05285 [Pedobacter sp.]|nr:hypothetical protein [Pedobacter sp.]
MTSDRTSAILYKELSAHALQCLSGGVASAHNTLFKPTRETWLNFKRLHLDQIDTYKQGEQVARRPGDDTCKYCEKFHLSNLKTIDKNKDISLGKQLEDCFSDFFNQELKHREINLTCIRADGFDQQQPDYMHMPDFKIIDSKGDAVFYFEFKAIFRPYLKISEKVRADYECYSHSQTLDISNGKKLENQRNLVEKIGVKKVVYVYWYDIPCVKGIFWLSAQRVYELWDNGDTPRYKRKTVAGDLNDAGYLRAAVNKIYLPLPEMANFDSLFELIQTG